MSHAACLINRDPYSFMVYEIVITHISLGSKFHYQTTNQGFFSIAHQKILRDVPGDS